MKYITIMRAEEIGLLSEGGNNRHHGVCDSASGEIVFSHRNLYNDGHDNVVTAEMIAEAMSRAYEAGVRYSVDFHGDAGKQMSVDDVLDLLRRTARRFGWDLAKWSLRATSAHGNES